MDEREGEGEEETYVLCARVDAIVEETMEESSQSGGDERVTSE